MAINCLSHREEVEISVMIAAELIDHIDSGVLTNEEVRSTLREMVAEVGNGWTDERLTEMVVNRILHDLSGRI